MWAAPAGLGTYGRPRGAPPLCSVETVTSSGFSTKRKAKTKDLSPHLMAWRPRGKTRWGCVCVCVGGRQQSQAGDALTQGTVTPPYCGVQKLEDEGEMCPVPRGRGSRCGFSKAGDPAARGACGSLRLASAGRSLGTTRIYSEEQLFLELQNLSASFEFFY